MKIQINTDHNIECHEALASKIKIIIESALIQVSDHITRVEVHLSDENGNKTGQNDKRCMLEARIEGQHPIAVTNNAVNLELAVEGAVDKLAGMIESTLGRLRHQKNRRTDPPLPGQKITEE